MNKVRNSLFTVVILGAAISLSLLIGALTTSPLRTAAAEKGRPQFYLTTTTHNGSQTLSACAGGYHMASAWEIIDPSNLRYNTSLGFVLDDSGSGPPAGGSAFGWVRSGGPAASASGPGATANCNAWTVGTFGAFGTVVSFSSSLDGFDTDAIDCDVPTRVWCMQD